MKLKEGFVLRTVAGETVVLPTNGVTDLDMMISLNDTGRFLWEILTKGATTEELVNAILEEYEVDMVTAQQNVDEFISKLKELDFLE